MINRITRQYVLIDSVLVYNRIYTQDTPVGEHLSRLGLAEYGGALHRHALEHILILVAVVPVTEQDVVKAELLRRTPQVSVTVRLAR